MTERTTDRKAYNKKERLEQLRKLREDQEARKELSAFDIKAILERLKR